MGTTDDKDGAGFTQLKPLILAEWPKVAADALDETEGDHDKIVDLVLASADLERDLVERQLAELAELAREDAGGNGASGRALQDVAQSLQSRMNEVASYVRGQMLADARSKARENFLVTVLMAIGLGFILGIIVRGLGRGRS
ncbi:MAG: hypothetical protein JRI23_33775 [Deltaproteobacteria bacterium]|jgi:hypothetical protein|nr:hypothetical protein [Deltaproteobacteria bacterium]MBW2537260.1 hypothetical protein [Deltaproteobacteria bacterium]